MKRQRTISFDLHPDPIFYFDPETFRILSVNAAAVRRYGWTEAEFLELGVLDIRPPEDRDKVAEMIRTAGDAAVEAKMWRHLTKSGDVMHVHVTSVAADFDGRPARLAVVRDLTRLVALERDNRRLLEAEAAARRNAEHWAGHWRRLFESVPGKFAVVTPDDARVVAVSDAYLAATGRDRAKVMGRTLREIFPIDPLDRAGDEGAAIRRSIDRVRDTGIADALPVMRFPVTQTVPGEGPRELRFWSIVNSPVIGPEGQVVYVIHAVEDVTPLVREGPEAAGTDDLAAALNGVRGAMQFDIMLRSRELDAARQALERRERMFRAAQRIADLGSWELDLGDARLEVSESLAEMLGLDPDVAEAPRQPREPRDLAAVAAPEDRDRLAAALAEVAEGRGFDLEHRLAGPPGPDGGPRVVRHVVEVRDTPDGRLAHGIVQDLTRLRLAEAKIEAMARLRAVAGQVGRLGGWRVDALSGAVDWTDETFALHGLPPGGPTPSVTEALSFYEPDCRDTVRDAVNRCVARGAPIDEVLRLRPRDAEPIWVRLVGEASRDDDGRVVELHGAVQDISELVEARQLGQLMARRLYDVVQNLGDAFVTLDRDWRYIFVNAEFERLTGLSSSQVLGRTVWEVFPQSVGSPFEKLVRTAMTERRRVADTLHLRTDDIWADVVAYPTIDGLAVLFRDATADHALQGRLRLLEAAVARQNDILIVTEADPIDAPDGPRIVFVNDAFTRVTGWSPEDALGRTPRFLQGEGTDPAARARIRAALAARRPVREEVLNRTRDGAPIWLEIDISPVADDTGAVSHFVSVQRDVTARKAEAHEAEMMAQRLRLTARASNDVIWDWDMASRRIWWNDKMTEVFGHSSEDMQPGAESWTDHIHPDDRARVLDGLWEVLRGEGDAWMDEYRFMRADGEAAVVIDRGFVIRDEAGRARRMVGSIIDVTARRRHEEQVREAERLEAVGRLSGGVAHDFNNLLTVILGNAELLGLRLHDRPDLARMAELTAEAARKGAALTRQMLAFARRQPLAPEPVDVPALLAGLAPLLRASAGAAVKLRLAAAPGTPPALADRTQLEAALVNLAVNARDAMPEGGSLAFGCDVAELDATYAKANPGVAPGDYVLITAADTGRGMTDEVVDKAFQPFFTTKDAGKGSGLGLSQVYGFVKQSGGHVKIYSEPGQGAVVKLYLPRAGGTADHAPAAPAAAVPPAGRGDHVLVVEDDAAVRAHCADRLRDFGFRVSEADTAQAALAVLDAHADVALLFTDVVLPGGRNGPALAAEARARRPGLRVLFTSGYTREAMIHDGRLDQGVDLLPKPYTAAELARRVAVALGRA